MVVTKANDDHRKFPTVVLKNVNGQEKILMTELHMTIKDAKEGSLVIQLKPESNEAQIRLKEFLSGDGVKEFLKQIFRDTEGLVELKDGACEIKVIVKAKEGKGNTFEPFLVLRKMSPERKNLLHLFINFNLFFILHI